MRALIADDDPMSRRMLELVLGKLGYEVTAETNGQAAFDRLTAADPPQLAILDWMMPQLDGPEVVRRVRARSGAPYVYMLLLTSKTQSSDMVKGLEAGADDYILKPFNVNELQARLRAGERVLASQRDLVAAREALRGRAAIDEATGAFGPGALQPLLARDLARSRFERASMSVVVAALDAPADLPPTVRGEMLAAASRRITAMLRPSDALVRASDDMLCVLLPNTTSRDAMIFSEHLRAASQAETVVTPKGAMSTGCSFGIASSDGAQVEAPMLLKMATSALEHARHGGRGQIVTSRRTAPASSPPPGPPPMPRAIRSLSGSAETGRGL
ncbi:MAG: response regulator [Myxococcota bacterium]|nr:response regulator [Myxococcota bacterium]